MVREPDSWKLGTNVGGLFLLHPVIIPDQDVLTAWEREQLFLEDLMKI